MRSILSILLFCVIGIAQAQSLNDLYPVFEMSFLPLIEAQLRSPSTAALPIEAMEAYALKIISQYSDKSGAITLPRALQTRNYIYTSNITLSRDIYDSSGSVILHQGTVLNVLQQFPTYHPDWIFIDGCDGEQVQWARNQLKLQDHRVILTNGAAQAISTQLAHEVFFDQRGYISQKLGIKHLPARVTRQGNTLLIQEINII
jgi:conjugal transfer pilus assembly protein TraW